MKKLINLFLLVPILLLTNCEDNPSTIDERYSEYDQATQNLLIELEDIATPISGSDPALDDTDLKFLDQFSETKIVALGEATGATKEFFQMKHRIFKYMVEKHNFKVFAFQGDFAETIRINRYVKYGEGNLDNLIENVMIYWHTRTKEVKDLLIWMKEYNESKAENDKIHFIGVDTNQKDYYPNLILNYLEKVDGSYFSEVDTTLTNLHYKPRKYLRTISWEKYNYYFDFLSSMIEKFENERENYINQSSVYDFKINLQVVKGLRQICTENYYNPALRLNPSYRELHSAISHDFILDLFDNNVKIVSWSSNEQIFPDDQLLGYKSMGAYLKERYGNDYKTISFGFSKGSFRAIRIIEGEGSSIIFYTITEEPKYQSLNYYFNKVALNNFCIDFSKISPGILRDLFNSDQELLMLTEAVEGNPEDYYKKVNLYKLSDMLIYFDETNTTFQFK